MNKEENQANYISIGKASMLSGLCLQTLRKLADQQKVISYKTVTGQRKFSKLNIIEMCSNKLAINENTNLKNNYIYTRVHSEKETDELIKQYDFIKSYNPNYTSYKHISDICSGIDFKRDGLSIILDSCIQKNIGEVVITHKDRLSKYGFDLIQLIVQKAGGKIIIINNENSKCSNIELEEDLVSFVNIMSNK